VNPYKENGNGKTVEVMVMPAGGAPLESQMGEARTLLSNALCQVWRSTRARYLVMNPQGVVVANYRCQECHAVIGKLVTVGTEAWLQIGTVEVRFLHGRCTTCKHFYHFDARKQSQAMKEDLKSERMKESKK